ncbi:hypothetical protein WA026_014543 [Henosepilachna vigintioctopunctata]|uniref:Large ribosomal subunit protein uL2 RNA-binding domain-containing protein n=1 Tax=Henosepilachna vigintioctopunctata TaxID=420089 RepID=A0AAW1UK38_9CUCU
MVRYMLEGTLLVVGLYAKESEEELNTNIIGLIGCFGPKEGPPLEERVIKIIKDGCRTANVALVASGSNLRYILATENMKAGDIIKTSCHIPRIPVRANEGDAYPLGALPFEPR